MNKRELSKVFSKLSREEVNLESHRVELAGIADRAKKFTEDLRKGNSNFMSDYMATIEVAIKNGSKELERLGAVSRLAKKTRIQLMEGLKDLGVSKSPVLDDLDKVISKYDNYVVKESKKYF